MMQREREFVCVCVCEFRTSLMEWIGNLINGG